MAGEGRSNRQLPGFPTAQQEFCCVHVFMQKREGDKMQCGEGSWQPDDKFSQRSSCTYWVTDGDSIHDGSCEILYGIILAHRLKNKILKKKYKALRPLLLMQPMQNMQEEY